ncbi:competence/damage-inducible protein A [Winogradskyella echinorum]|uniref:CinA-like protein n=1 Tax=Winogradskyella echinorum TaxID=538189 RepID=A0ABR6Y222_9FLAO|nr:competence/damage-inducible protein A [Winogradskyella echinorum]MBC3846789.1 competence/damage-inducible protein A [Winogradskyella echinorum]MBC5751137.1 competence/damage-inducible protein A [Winogradskyella echinorum]
MLAEIITIGDEILIGQIVDTNSAFLGKELNKIGVSVYQITSIQDDKEHILKALKEAEENADIVIITGGLGPTKDDITKHTLCEYFGDSLIEDKDVLANVEQIFSKYTIPLLDVNKQQALVPSKAKVLMNHYGTAPGMWIEKGEKVFVSLPGVPYEMKALISDQVIPQLRNKFKFPYILHKTILTYGLGESSLAERIESWEDALPSFIKLAYLPSLGRVRLRLSAKAMDKNMVELEMEKQIHLVLPLIKDVFVGFEEDKSIEAVIGLQLTEMGKTLAIAESCTGGRIAQAFTANAGASKYFKGSIVSYATESKTNILDVKAQDIESHSVVSREVAEAMAQNVRVLFNSDFAISTTGNAGPSKGDSDADVGTVWIAIATKDKVYSEVFNFGNHREKVIGRATNKAFEMLQKEILKK